MKEFVSTFHSRQGVPFQSDEISLVELDFEKNLRLLAPDAREDVQWKEFLDALDGAHFSMRLFSSDKVEPLILWDLDEKQVYVKEFYFYTLIGKVQAQFYFYLAFLLLQHRENFTDLVLDLHQKTESFRATRRSQLSFDELEVLSFCHEAVGFYSLHWLAVLFSSSVLSVKPHQISFLEKKVIRDILGTREAKHLLGLEENAYRYLETPGQDNERVEREKSIFSELSKEFTDHQLGFEEYVQERLAKKNLLIWNWWTISPFVSADIAILLPMLVELKKIKKIYIDLPKESHAFFANHTRGDNVEEDLVEEEIKKIYPPILESYQKETLPYMVLLNKIREFQIPIECFGFSGIELMEKEPLMSPEHKLYYPIDKSWKKSLCQTYQEMTTSSSDELTIFFYFMKPMFTLPSGFNDERIERIIHTDKFTGFGPNQPENSLSMFSRHAPRSQKSFVIPELPKRSIRDEIIVYFPYMEDKALPKLEDAQFNKFHLYDTMIYSSHSGGGGGNERKDTPLPQGERVLPR
jgi:hypothetical protein